MFDLDAIEALAVLEAARQEVYGLREGTRKWTVSIPFDRQRDTDCVILAGLDAAEGLVSQDQRVRELEAALRALTAGEPTYWTRDDELACLYCNGDRNAEHGDRLILHETDCPWVNARALLGEGEA